MVLMWEKSKKTKGQHNRNNNLRMLERARIEDSSSFDAVYSYHEYDRQANEKSKTLMPDPMTASVTSVAVPTRNLRIQGLSNVLESRFDSGESVKRNSDLAYGANLKRSS